MSEAKVRYESALGATAGAVPVNTEIAIHTRDSDGADVQDVYLDGGALDPVGILGYRSSDGTYQPLRLDKATNSIQVIEYEHHEIHSGSFYRAGFQKDIANGGTAIFALTTPNTTSWLHFRPAVDVELEARIMLYENPTSITGGTPVTPRNANRNSANTSGATVVTDPTIDTTGAVVLGNLVEGSGKSSGGESTSGFEWVLKQNTSYVLVVTNLTTSANQINIRCQWYEHTDIG